MSKFLHDDEAKAIAIPQVFSENNRAKKKTRVSIFYRNISKYISIYKQLVHALLFSRPIRDSSSNLQSNLTQFPKKPFTGMDAYNNIHNTCTCM